MAVEYQAIKNRSISPVEIAEVNPPLAGTKILPGTLALPIVLITSSALAFPLQTTMNSVSPPRVVFSI